MAAYEEAVSMVRGFSSILISPWPHRAANVSLRKAVTITSNKSHLRGMRVTPNPCGEHLNKFTLLQQQRNPLS
jgi:hypothetical protein